MNNWNILTNDTVIINGEEVEVFEIRINTMKYEGSENSLVQWLGMVSVLEANPLDDYRTQKAWYEVIGIAGRKYGYKVNTIHGMRPPIYQKWEGQSDTMLSLWRAAIFTETAWNSERLENFGLVFATSGGRCWDYNNFLDFWYPVYHIIPADEVETCEDCGAPVKSDEVSEILTHGQYRRICHICHAHYRTCENCGATFRPGLYSNFCSQDCYDQYDQHDHRDHRSSEDVIHHYSYTPDEWIYHAAAGFDSGAADRYFGIELEVKESDSDEDVAWFNKDEEEVLYFQKYDSSISAGTEVVFHPQSREYFDKSGYNLITELYNNFEYLRCGTNSRIGSGMHVHISRSAFHGDEAIRKFCKLINVKYEKSLTEFSERTADELEEWAMFHPEYPTCGEINRYTAVNLRNDDTVEVRIFRTPARPQKVAEVIHLLDALVDVANGNKTTCSWLDLQEARIARK